MTSHRITNSKTNQKNKERTMPSNTNPPIARGSTPRAWKRRTSLLSAFAMAAGGLLVSATATLATTTLTPAVASAAGPCEPQAPQTAGVFDGFDTTNGSESSVRSDDHEQFWLDTVSSGLEFKDLDEREDDQWYAETFPVDLEPGTSICDATLTFAARNVADTLFDDTPNNDSIGVHFIVPDPADPSKVIRSATTETWAQDIRDYATTPDNYGGTIDLGSLLPSSSGATPVLDAMQRYGFLDVWIQDDTWIDAVMLEISTESNVTFTKLTNGEEQPDLTIGERVTWTYIIENEDPEVPMQLLGLSDDPEGAIDIDLCEGEDFEGTFVAPGQSVTCVLEGIASSEDYVNTAELIFAFEGGGETVLTAGSGYTATEATCEANLIQNPRFDDVSANPTDKPDEDISIAGGWGPIWEQASGVSSADVFAPGEWSQSSDEPAPPSGNYAGFWLGNDTSRLRFREGAMTTLAPSLERNSGKTTLSFDTAQLIAADTEVGVFGVFANAGAPALGSVPTGVTTPANVDLFGNELVVELGRAQIVATTGNQRVRQSIEIDTTAFPRDVDRIFLTRTEAAGGSAYIGVDNFCLPTPTPQPPAPCSLNYFTNGDFEDATGDPNAVEAEDISLASGWGPIWNAATGVSTGDLFAPDFAYSTFGLPDPGTEPTPVSGNFALAWIDQRPGANLEHREGFMNQLANDLRRNTGTTTLSFVTSQLTSSDATVGVYGVLRGSQPLGVTPQSGTVPANVDLFGTRPNGTPNVTLLGEVELSVNDTAARVTRSIPIDTASLPGTIDRIFVTSTESSPSGGRALVSFDDFCMPAPRCDVRTPVLNCGRIFEVPDGAATVATLKPVRLFDTRTPEGPTGFLAPGSTLDVAVAGELGVPEDASAVILNVTATESDAAGFVTVWATGQDRPTASNLNLTGPGQTVPNLVIAPISEDGQVSFYTHQGVHLLADVAGYFVPLESEVLPNALSTSAVASGRYLTVEPARIFDSREGEPAPGPKGFVSDGNAVTVETLGSSAVNLPSSVSAVAVNVTATQTGGPGFVTTYPSGTERPNASSLNFSEAGATTANLVVVPVGDDGNIELFTVGGAHLIVDIVGIFTDETAEPGTSGIYVPIDPERVFDTREEPAPFGALAAGDTIDVTFGGVGGVPAEAGAVFATVTGTETAGPGFVKAWATGAGVPDTSTVNFAAAGVTRPNAAIIELGDGGNVSFFSHAGNHLLVDVAGYFTR